MGLLSSKQEIAELVDELDAQVGRAAEAGRLEEMRTLMGQARALREEHLGGGR